MKELGHAPAALAEAPARRGRGLAPDRLRLTPKRGDLPQILLKPPLHHCQTGLGQGRIVEDVRPKSNLLRFDLACRFKLFLGLEHGQAGHLPEIQREKVFGRLALLGRGGSAVWPRCVFTHAHRGTRFSANRGNTKGFSVGTNP